MISIMGGLIPTYFLSRWLISELRKSYNGILLYTYANLISLLIAACGWSLFGQDGWLVGFGRGAILYLIPQLIWFIVDVYKSDNNTKKRKKYGKNNG